MNKRFDPVCFACGKRGHVKGADICPARAATCLKCRGPGHFARQCLKRANNEVRAEAAPKRIRAIHEDVEQENDEKYIFYAMGKNTFLFKVGGINIPTIIDSGAAANIISQKTWNHMKQMKVSVWDMSTEADRNFTCYASNVPMEITGTFMATVEGGGKKIDAKFYVAKDGQQCLLGEQTAKSLQVLKPVQQAFRGAPYALEDKVNEKLETLLVQGIIERVSGPSPWVSPMVPVLKESGDIRLCIDMRRANQAVIRETHPLPLVDELLGSVNGATTFSKVDIKDAYHQLEISERSRPITTFITKSGLFRYKRLMFGVSCAPEIFQKTMETILAGLEGIIVYLDDIVVFGSSKQEHDNRLQTLLKRLEEYGVLLNHQKCIYGVSELEFLGHVLSKKGVSPTESRMKAIQSFREPRTVAELRSFLDLITYVGRFIPHLASKTAPLRSLFRTGSVFKWQNQQHRAFESIKEAVSDVSYLGFFDKKDKTKLIVDASPEGLGAVLLQVNEDGQHRIIAFASKALSELEQKYFQTEREALAIVWGVERFSLYLLGTKFQLITDCKALKFLFNARSRLCPRIERWVLRIQSFNYEIIYEPGATNLADALSRLSVATAKPFDKSVESYIHQLVDFAVPEAVTLDKVTAETKEDATLQDVIRALQTGCWTETTKGFNCFKTELHAAKGVLMRDDRLVIPEKLRQQVLTCAHEGHPGMSVMKRRLRQKVWWPKMDEQVEKFVKSCGSCTLVSAISPPEPMLRTKMPDKPWSDVAIDFLGPLPSGHYLLVLVDYFSRFTEVIIMKQTTTDLTVQALFETFSRFGVPETLRSDNGPQFISEPFKAFCQEFGIEHQKIIPYWPQANGEVERMNNTILKRLRISQEENRSKWKWDLRSFLLMYNSTPHSTSGIAPSALMFGRVLRDKLPSVHSRLGRLTEAIQDQDWERKIRTAGVTDIRRQARSSDLVEGDIVVAKRIVKENKLSSNYAPEKFEIVKRMIRCENSLKSHGENIS
ncbi:uncharacterized protein K02A2.6-like [Topomyia yanbarensis]|uniref:uncharacterized protein K02A2.6-like n=1 Tax=Topomyia yanbarensis TaxID=2498891 RepID=UPI00273B217A|nr:uncharacterized protein K02A2.6-like [Topomyia yanbarensis]